MRKFLGVFSKIGNTPSQISFEIPEEIRKREKQFFHPVVLRTFHSECLEVRELLVEDYGWCGEKLILVHPGSSYTEKSHQRHKNPKEWTIENWRETISGVGKLSPDSMFILTGTANERRIAEKILSGVTVKAVSLAGELSLRSLFALQSMAHSCITVDTGVAHTATALGCPTVILYGNFDPRTMGACSPKGWGPTITIRGFRDGGELNSQIIADPIKNIRPETVVRLWEKLPPRSNEPCSECLVSHYCEGNMTGEVLPIQFY